jgi:hypothetical protein
MTMDQHLTPWLCCEEVLTELDKEPLNDDERDVDRIVSIACVVSWVRVQSQQLTNSFEGDGIDKHHVDVFNLGDGVPNEHAFAPHGECLDFGGVREQHGV